MNFDSYIDASKEEMIETLRGALKIKSVSGADGSPFPYGQGVHDCLEYVLGAAEEMGFRTCDLDGRVGWAEYGGEDLEMIAVVTHLDVVPEGDGWTHDPYGGETEDGRLYGRGTMDDKGAAVTALYALKAIKDSGVGLKRRVRLLFGCDEEAGCGDMKYYVESGAEIPVAGFTPDGEYPLINGEKGLITEYYRCAYSASVREVAGGTAVNMVPDSAYAVLADGTRIETAGRAAHGSTPEKGDNAIAKLIDMLDALRLEGKEGETYQFLRNKIGYEYDGRSMGIKMEDEVSGPLTFNLGTIRGDAGGITVGVNYRYPVTKKYEDCVPEVRRRFAEAGFELDSASVADKLYVSEDSALVKTLMDVYNGYTGENARPISIGGGTYAKTIPNILAFGPIFPDDEVTEHKADENMKIERLYDVAKINARAIYALCNEI